MSLLLKGGDVITVNEDGEVIHGGCVGIKNGKIDFVGTYEDGLEERYDRVINCEKKAVMPGFVNAHNHGAMVMFRNYADDLKLMDWLFNKIFPLEDKLDGDIAYWGSCLAMLEMIKCGTTAFCDMYMFMDKTAKGVSQSGMKAALSRGLSGESGDDMDYRLKEALDLYEEYNNTSNGRIKVMLGPHSIYTCSVPYLEKVSKVSEEYGIPIQVHLSETKEEVKNSRGKYDVSPVKLLENTGILKEGTLAAHCVVVDDDDIEILAKKKVSVVHNPNSNLKLASGIAPVVKMMDKGINVCIGTDGASSNNNLDMLEEMRFASYLAKVYCDDPTVLPVDTCLRMATVNGARALGFENAGCIRVGNAADIIVINTEKPHYYPRYNIKSALVYSGNSSDVETVIIDGRVVMENGSILTLDEDRILFEIESCAKRLVI